MSDCEDLELNRLLKGALEAKGTFAFRRPVSVRRWMKWSVPTLLAASLAILALPRATVVQPSYSLSETIGLLSEADGVDLGEESIDTPADLLLAWQDAPCFVAD